jgi:phosphate-selective porin OprO/OprP
MTDNVSVFLLISTSTRRIMKLSFTACLVAAMLVPHVASAQDTAAATDKPAKKKAEKVAKKKDNPVAFDAGPLKANLTARFSGDMRTAGDDLAVDGTDLTVPSRRLGVSGSISKRITFEVERDFAKTRDEWRDAYVDVRALKAVQFKTGRFKVPFGREELTGETNLDFVRRSLLGKRLSPGRDTGVMVHGKLLGKAVEYNAGYFAGDGDNSATSTTSAGSHALAARAVVAPFGKAHPLFRKLEFGADAVRSDVQDQLGLRAKTVFSDTVFFNHVFVNGRRLRLGGDAEWEYGPASASGELVAASEERNGMGFGSTDLPGVHASGWYAAATWAVTGETKHGWITPRRDLFSGGVGAIELAARTEALRFDDVFYAGSALGLTAPADLTGNADRATTLGINWYLNRFVRVQSNIVFESVRDPRRSPAPVASGRFTNAVFRIEFVL